MDPTVFNVLPTVFGTVFKRFTTVFNSFLVLLTHARCACALAKRAERTKQERAHGRACGGLAHMRCARLRRAHRAHVDGLKLKKQAAKMRAEKRAPLQLANSTAMVCSRVALEPMHLLLCNLHVSITPETIENRCEPFENRSENRR